MKIKKFSEEDLSYLYCSWEKLGNLAERLVFKILGRGLKFDRIVALATGGLAMSRFLKDSLGVEKLSVMQVEFYTGIGETRELPVITQSVPVSVKGERILVFDDINDTGKTLKTAVSYLKLRGAKRIYTSVIFQKPHTSFPSDFYAEETTSWVIFPDEARETIELLKKRWCKRLPLEEIRKRLLEIGFNKRLVERFIKN